MITRNGSDNLLDLVELKLYRCFATKDVDQNLDLVLGGVDFLNVRVEVRKRTRSNSNGLAHFPHWAVDRALFADGILDVCNLGQLQRCRLRVTDKLDDADSVADEVPRRIIEYHVDEDVTGVNLAVNFGLTARSDLGLFFGRQQHFEDLLVPKVKRLRAALDIGGDLLFVARICVDGIPVS